MAWGTGLDEVTDYLVASDGSLWYCRQAVNGVSLTGQIRRIVYTGPVSVSDDGVGGLDFLPPYPLPARDGAAFEYRLSDARAVELSLFDLVGGGSACSTPVLAGRVRTASDGTGGTKRVARWRAASISRALVAGRSERVRRIVVGR